MKAIKFTIQQLEIKSKSRNSGYLEEVMSIARRSGDTLELDQEQFDYIRNKYTPARKWPSLLLPMKLLAKPGDIGLGDIIAREIGSIGGDAFKKWYQKVFGKSCGCEKRQERWNQKYPLIDSETQSANGSLK